MKYKNLFSPIKINQLMIKNRIVAAPISEIYEEKALGGAGIVIAGHAIVQYGKSSYARADEPDIFTKYEIEKTVSRIRKVHQAGAKASIELFHAGRYARVDDYAYGVIDEIREDGVEVKGLNRETMNEILEAYYQSAKNAKDAGFDMIFMHFGHGWLPAEFLSPLFNKRTDEYGGRLENRMKFPLEILKTVREAVGKNYPIDMRISAYEWVEGSIEFDDVKAFIKEAQKYIDTVQISAGLDINHEGNVHMATTNFEEHMPNVHWAEAVKKEVSIPVSVVGAVLSPEEAEELIASKKVDMVAFGRSFIADPYWPKKVLEEKREDMRPCLRCLQCYHISTNRRNVGCSVNPRFTNEDFIPYDIELANERKKVVVIGGGPAGLEAAITASKRGHQVILIEKENELGGQLIHISKEYYKEDVKRFYEYLMNQIKKSDVDIRLHETATYESIKQLRPDYLIIAVGASQIKLPIQGIEKPHVLDAITAIEHPEKVGDKVVIVGGGTIGAELALEYALIDKKEVSVIELGSELAPQGNMLYKIALHQKIKQASSLHIYLETLCQEIHDHGIMMKNQDGANKEIDCDTVIYCTGLKPNQDIAESFYGITPNVAMIGDCVQPRKIMEAIFEGHSIALNI